MSENESYIVKRRDSLDVDQMILQENKDALAEFLDEWLPAIAEAITGALAAGPKSWAVSSGKLVQGALKGKLFQQVSREIKELRNKGKIPDDFQWMAGLQTPVIQRIGVNHAIFEKGCTPCMASPFLK